MKEEEREEGREGESRELGEGGKSRGGEGKEEERVRGVASSAGRGLIRPGNQTQQLTLLLVTKELSRGQSRGAWNSRGSPELSPQPVSILGPSSGPAGASLTRLREGPFAPTAGGSGCGHPLTQGCL